MEISHQPDFRTCGSDLHISCQCENKLMIKEVMEEKDKFAGINTQFIPFLECIITDLFEGYVPLVVRSRGNYCTSILSHMLM